MSHISRLQYQRVLPHEPACIIEKRIEWDRSDLLRSELAFIHIRLERRRFARIKVPVWPRPQEHATWHVRFPKVERLADDVHLHTKRLRIRGSSDAVWSCTDDEERG